MGDISDFWLYVQTIVLHHGERRSVVANIFLQEEVYDIPGYVFSFVLFCATALRHARAIGATELVETVVAYATPSVVLAQILQDSQLQGPDKILQQVEARFKSSTFTDACLHLLELELASPSGSDSSRDVHTGTGQSESDGPVGDRWPLQCCSRKNQTYNLRGDDIMI